MTTYIKAPFQVRGDQYPTLPFLFKYFPEQCHLFLDPFGGSTDVSLNMYLEKRAKQIHCFDLNESLMKANADFYRISTTVLLKGLVINCARFLKVEGATYTDIQKRYNAMDKHFGNYQDISDSL